MSFNLITTSATAIWLGSLLAALAITPEQLNELQAQGEKITIIDLRSNVHYQKGHIPGAINIPVTLIPEKKLPPLGKVIVYDDGLGRSDAEAAVIELNQKGGISAEVLEGGYSAWEMSRSATTKAPGMTPEEIQYLTYQDLKSASKEDMVIVDLRKPAPPQRQSAPSGRLVAPVTPTIDLSQEFPNTPITKSPFDLPQKRQSNGAGAPPLLVLIDSGDGTAQETARKLKANGVTRVVILAGGEEIIVRGGQSGLQRLGPGQGLQNGNGR